VRFFFLIIARNNNGSVKQLFNIKAGGEIEIMQPVLSFRMGERHCCFSITGFATQELQQLAYYTDDEVNESFLLKLFAAHPELNGNFYRVSVCYDHPQSTLVPLKYYNHEKGTLLLKTMFGVNVTAIVFSEAVTEWQLYNIYAVPKEVHGWMSMKFASGKFWHQYSVSIKNIIAADEDGSLLVDLRKEDFTVLAAANSKLLIAQTFNYSTPEDVLYYLLKVCQQFGLSQREVHLGLSGLVDLQSALYKGLHQYFIHIEFRDAKWTIPISANNECPAHFFTSLNDLSGCAS